MLAFKVGRPPRVLFFLSLLRAFDSDDSEAGRIVSSFPKLSTFDSKLRNNVRETTVRLKIDITLFKHCLLTIFNEQWTMAETFWKLFRRVFLTVSVMVSIVHWIESPLNCMKYPGSLLCVFYFLQLEFSIEKLEKFYKYKPLQLKWL